MEDTKEKPTPGEQFADALDHFDLSLLHCFVGWIKAAADGDAFTKPNRRLQKELKTFIEVHAAYDLKHRNENKHSLVHAKPTTTDETLKALANGRKV